MIVACHATRLSLTSVNFQRLESFAFACLVENTLTDLSRPLPATHGQEVAEQIRQGGHGGDAGALRAEKGHHLGAGRGDHPSGHSDAHNGGEGGAACARSHMLCGHRQGEAAQGRNSQLEPLAQIHAEDSIGVNIYECILHLDLFRL